HLHPESAQPGDFRVLAEILLERHAPGRGAPPDDAVARQELLAGRLRRALSVRGDGEKQSETQRCGEECAHGWTLPGKYRKYRPFQPYNELRTAIPSEDIWKVPRHCRDAPWGVSGAATSAVFSPTPRGRTVPMGSFSPPRRRPTGRLYSGGGRAPP